MSASVYGDGSIWVGECADCDGSPCWCGEDDEWPDEMRPGLQHGGGARRWVESETGTVPGRRRAVVGEFLEDVMFGWRR